MGNPRFGLPTVTLIWMGTVGIGLLLLGNYESAPGQAGHPLLRWPTKSRIERSKDRPTLVMFAHPRCPCTRATIGELALIMARCRGLVDAHVVFYKPDGS